MPNYFHRYWVLIISFLFLCLVSGGVLLIIKFSQHQPQEIIIQAKTTKEYTREVLIEGAVTNPGYYPFKDDDTISNIVQSAGPISEASPDLIKIYVPSTNELNSKQKTQKIDLNKAEVWLLEALPGIGHVKAQSIADYRTRHGYFRSIEDLTKVDGISKTIVDNIRPLVIVGD